MDLNLFDNKRKDNNIVNEFIEELKKALNNTFNKKEKNNELDEYDLYEKRKIFLDNKSRNGNDLAWIMDKDSICISENGDGGPTSINEIDLPQNKNVGEVYEKIDGKYVYNEEITNKLRDITK